MYLLFVQRENAEHLRSKFDSDCLSMRTQCSLPGMSLMKGTLSGQP